jgi:deoxyribodipyrimidine photo-lyase
VTALVLFDRDLRLTDHPALDAAVRSGLHVIPVHLHDPASEGAWADGGAARWWKHHALADLDAQLRACGSRLVIRRGGDDTLDALIHTTGARAVFWSQRYEPAAIARDTARASRLRAAGLWAESFNAALLHEPHTIATKQGGPFQVFTPFWKACCAKPAPAAPLPAPARIPAPTTWPVGEPLDSLGLLPRIPWDVGFARAWAPTRAGALARLNGFCCDTLADYATRRDLPADDGTSRLSPYLHWGQLSPREAVQAVRDRLGHTAVSSTDHPGSARFLAELGWREFAHHLLAHFPHTVTEPLRPAFARFPWEPDAAFLHAWQQGRTGYPIVDAAMRQLWQTGWMHNRLRMVVASFLVKHGLQPWQDGARWFWDTLVDADLAANTLGWQWSAGCGADAAPYFRVFNPILQGEKFDPDGAFVRVFVPEVSRLPASHTHRPWEAPATLLATAGLRLGRDYPFPIVDPKHGRDRALAAYARMPR